MEIEFADPKMEKIFQDERKMLKAYGKARATKLQMRMAVLDGAASLADISRNRPERCHELIGNRKGQLTVDLEGPYRLVFEPTNEPRPLKADGGLDWGRVTSIRILEIADTHE